jgi:hypothetical protein
MIATLCVCWVNYRDDGPQQFTVEERTERMLNVAEMAKHFGCYMAIEMQTVQMKVP